MRSWNVPSAEGIPRAASTGDSYCMGASPRSGASNGVEFDIPDRRDLATQLLRVDPPIAAAPSR